MSQIKDTANVVHAFTTKYPVRVNAIITQIGVGEPLLENAPVNMSTYKPEISNAIWDTGATGSTITKAIAEKLGLKPVGKIPVNTANGIAIQNVYYVSVVLPNNLVFNALKVTEVESLTGSSEAGAIDMLIGMDIISHGDFAITNYGGKTTVSFIMPSLKEIDFVAQSNAHNKNIPPQNMNRQQRREWERTQKKQ